MGWVLVGIFVILIIEVLSQIFGFFYIGFSMNKYMILALIVLAVAAFYAWISSLSYNDYIIKEKIVKNIKRLFSSDQGGSAKSGEVVHTHNSINLSEITLENLVAELQSTLTSPRPLIFKGWGNKRLELDIQRVRLLNDYIEALAETGQSFIRLQADAIVSYEKIQSLAHIELNELRARVRKSALDLMLIEDQYQLEVTRIRTQTARLELELQQLNNQLGFEQDRHNMDMLERKYLIENNKDRFTLEMMIKEAEVYCLKLKTQSDVSVRDKIGDLFDKIIRELNIGNITPTQALILTSLFGKGGAIQDFESEKRILDQMIEKAKQETEIKRQEAKEKFLENEHKIFKLELDKRNFDPS